MGQGSLQHAERRQLVWRAPWLPATLLATLLALPACSSPEDVAENARTSVLSAVERRDWSSASRALTAFRAARPETPHTLSEVAGLMVAAGEAREAIWMLEEAIARFPKGDSLRVELARAALLVGQPGRAVMALEAISDDSSVLTEALVVETQGWLELGNVGETRRSLADARVALARKSNVTLEAQLETSQLGLTALLGEGDAGLAELRALIEGDPGNTTAWSVLVRELRREGRAEEARSLLEAGIAAQPDRIDLNAPLIATHLALGDETAAERVLRDRIKRHPTPGAQLALARIRASRGNSDAASARYSLAIAEFPKSAMLRSGRTELLLDLGQMDKAGVEFGKFRAVSKQGPQTEYLYARVELALDKPSHALRRLAEVVKKLDTPSTHYWLGTALEATDDLVGAESHYVRAQRGNPADVAAAIGAARLARRRGDWRAAVRAGRAAIQYGPHEPEGWRHLAASLTQLGDFVEAEELALRRLKRFPNEVDSHVRLAEVLRAQQRLDASLAVLDGAGKVGVAKKPRLVGRERGMQELRAEKKLGEADAALSQAPEIVAERALLLAAQEKIAEGFQLAEAMLKKEGGEAPLSKAQEARLLTVKATMLFYSRREEGALSAVRLALALDSDDLRPLALRIGYYASLRRLDMAQRDCESYLDQRPNDPRVNRLYGLVLSALGEKEKAADAYRRAVEFDDQDWAAANNLAMILVERGEFDEALAVAGHASRLASDNASVLDTEGYVALRAGEPKRAVEVFEQALAIQPGFVDVLLHLAEAYGAVGRAGEGRQILAKLESGAKGDRQVLAKVAEVRARIP